MDYSIFDPLHDDFRRVMKVHNKSFDEPTNWFKWGEVIEQNFDVETMYADIEDKMLAERAYFMTDNITIRTYLMMKFDVFSHIGQNLRSHEERSELLNRTATEWKNRTHNGWSNKKS